MGFGQISEFATGYPGYDSVIGVNNANGEWQYSINNGGTWTAFGSPSEDQARLKTSERVVDKFCEEVSDHRKEERPNKCADDVIQRKRTGGNLIETQRYGNDVAHTIEKSSR